MNKLYKDHRKGYEELYWIINGNNVYHLKSKPSDVSELSNIKDVILKSDYLVLEYI